MPFLMFTGPGQYTIRSLHRPALCLDIPSQTAHKESGRVQVFPNNGAAYQLWVVAEDPRFPGCYTIHASLGPSKTLGVAANSLADLATIEFQQPDDTPSQRWRIIPASAHGYRIINSASSLCLDLRDQAAGHGGTLQQRPPREVTNQFWAFDPRQ